MLVLNRSITYAIAFFKGLLQEERAVVEAGYIGGAVSVLVCTPTMAMGVNLPARRVVFYRPFIPHPSSPITPSQLEQDCGTLSDGKYRHHRYRQMAGRAGRAGIDEAGIVQSSRDSKGYAKIDTFQCSTF
eukprot:1137470-Pelagomonas_calceolata.AAC.3